MAITRKEFLASLGLGAAALGLASLTSAAPQTKPLIMEPGDTVNV